MIEARERLKLMDVLDYSNRLTTRDRKSKHRKLYKTAYPDNFKKNIVTTDQLELF
jgi:hypothetical protein